MTNSCILTELCYRQSSVFCYNAYKFTQNIFLYQKKSVSLHCEFKISIIMLTTSNPQYGHYLVKKMQVVESSFGFQTMTDKMKYGVFRIDHNTSGFIEPNVTDPLKAHKIHLTPMQSSFIDRDWYACDILSAGCRERCEYQSFDNYMEALDWANDMNNIK